jgi:DNA-binding GntR family transcriptional regulator
MRTSGDPVRSPSSGSARDRAHAQIRDAIVRTVFAPGTRLSENELATRFEVSRQPIREALILLAEERLVTIRPQSGTYVSLVDDGEVELAQFIREAVELSSLPRARSLTAADRERLESILLRQRQAEDRDAFYPLDEEFHRYLLGLAGHENAWSVVTRSKGHLDRARYLGFESNRQLSDYADDHERIYRALCSGAIEEAVDEMRTHLRQVLRDIDKVRTDQPHIFG